MNKLPDVGEIEPQVDVAKRRPAQFSPVKACDEMKPIRLTKHAQGYTTSRGFIPAEVEEAIRTCPWGTAELGRHDCRKDFPYGRDWNGKHYATKQVRPVFADNAEEIVVITVYTYYF